MARGNKRYFYVNCHLIAGIGVEFTAYKGEMVKESPDIIYVM